MLKRDPAARFEKPGLMRYQFQAGKILSPQKIWPQEYRELCEKQALEPVPVFHNLANARTWWMFRDQFYWENDGLTSTEVKALILDRETKKKQRVDRAVAQMHGISEDRAKRREPIPRDVQAFVWNRDGGKCVRCESRERLEFDHIIPLSRGGANTSRNLQLLCEACNRSKGASIG